VSQPDTEDIDVIRDLTSLPPGDALSSAVDILAPLSDAALAMLKRYGNREIRERSFGRVGTLRGSRSSDTTRSALLESGLLGKVITTVNGDYYGLTPLGRQAARVLTAIEPLPPKAGTQLLKLRERAK
jgi:hypothetical protein